MIPIDTVIAQMKETDCLNCSCSPAIFDDTGESVEIYGSFCTLIAGYPHIAIIARSIETGEDVWSKVCDTGRLCSIPFTSEAEFKCK